MTVHKLLFYLKSKSWIKRKFDLLYTLSMKIFYYLLSYNEHFFFFYDFTLNISVSFLHISDADKELNKKGLMLQSNDLFEILFALLLISQK